VKVLFGLVFLLAGWSAVAADAVTVSGLRDPVDKSYRRMMKGMALFEAQHAMAPAATLRYRLLPRKAGTDMRGIALSVVADTFELPVPLAADNTFTLGRNAKALAEDASVRPNRKAGSMTWRADVRTPGLPDSVRRLGDLRLECRVGMEAGLVSQYPSLFDRLMDRLLGADGFCGEKEPRYLFFAERPLYAVTLVHGERREVLPVGKLYSGLAKDRAPLAELSYCDCEALLDRAYFVPLGDRSWPDDTLVELESMDAPAGETYGNLAGSDKAAVRAIFGEPKVLRFGDFELWTYDYERSEIVVLFDAAGTVTKARLRQ
jgi:hypothetical protein